MEIIQEDSGFIDLTTQGLEIGHLNAHISFSPKHRVVLSGVEMVAKMCREMNLFTTVHHQEGDVLEAGELILEATGSAKEVHMAWKACQNVLEYACGVATKTEAMLTSARAINPNIQLLTTRKIIPLTKELAIKAVHAGGGAHHRLGLYDSILIFKQHRVFFDNDAAFEAQFEKMKRRYLEKKIIVEVETLEEARYFASLGADILQCEKLSPEALAELIAVLRVSYPSVLFSATGGVNEHNIAEYTKCGIDFVVSSSPYHAEPADIRVTIGKC